MVTVVLGRDVTLAVHHVDRRHVVATVAKAKFIDIEPGRHSKQKVAHADAKYGLLINVQSFSQVFYSFHGLTGISRAIGNEETVKLVCNICEIEVPWKNCDGGTTHHKGPQYILLRPTI